MTQRMHLAGLCTVAGALAGSPLAVGLAVVSAVAPLASAQLNDDDPESIAMKRQTIARLMKRVTIELRDHRLEDVVQFISDLTQAEIMPLWAEGRGPVGLDREARITLNARNVTALKLIEMVLERVSRDVRPGEASTWQFTDYGAFEFGPKELLNKNRRVEMYDINDLLMEIPDYNNAPEFDLNTVFQVGGQQGGGGGGGQSPFQQQGTDIDRRDRQELVQDIIDLIITTVETEQWVDNGGEAATVRELRGALFINAPDYIHRQINGYAWWPARQQSARTINGRRYVTLDGSYDFAKTGLLPTIEVQGVP